MNDNDFYSALSFPLPSTFKMIYWLPGYGDPGVLMENLEQRRGVLLVLLRVVEDVVAAE